MIRSPALRLVCLYRCRGTASWWQDPLSSTRAGLFDFCPWRSAFYNAEAHRALCQRRTFVPPRRWLLYWHKSEPFGQHQRGWIRHEIMKGSHLHSNIAGVESALAQVMLSDQIWQRRMKLVQRLQELLYLLRLRGRTAHAQCRKRFCRVASLIAINLRSGGRSRSLLALVTSVKWF